MMRSVLPLAGTLVMISACGGENAVGDGTWTGSTRDSSGVTIVENPAVGSWTAEQAWRVEPELTIGAAEGEAHLQFGQISGIAIDDEGGVHVLDLQAGQIQSFDASGDHLRTISKKGNGPGEIAIGMGLFHAPGDTLLVPDAGAARITSFPMDGSEAESFPLRLSAAQPIKFEAMTNGTMVAQLRTFTGGGGAPLEVGSHDLVLTVEEETSDTLASIPAGQTLSFQSDLPVIRIFAPEPMWTLGSDDAVFASRNDRTTIHRYENGQLTRVIERNVEPQEVTDADERLIRGAAEDAIRQQAAGAPPQMIERVLSAMTVGDYFPTLLQLQGGPDNTLWVQRFTRFDEMTEEQRENFNPLDLGSPHWEVYDAEGRYLGEVEMPALFQPIGFKGDVVFGVWRDDLDVQYAMTARVVRP